MCLYKAAVSTTGWESVKNPTGPGYQSKMKIAMYNVYQCNKKDVTLRINKLITIKK